MLGGVQRTGWERVPPAERTVEDRTAAVIRVAVIAVVGLALVLGPQLARGRVVPLAVLVTAAFGYALVVAVAEMRGRPLLPAWSTTSLDGALALVACAFTGGAESILVAVLPLVVIAAAVRGGAVAGRFTALVAGAGFTLGAVLASDADVPLVDRWLAGAWWTGFLMAAAVLVGVLVRMLERQLDAAALSRARVSAEREALQEERDLRARLLAAQQARLDGVRVVLHEFRTPVASLTALTADLAAGRLSVPSQQVATRLLAEHAVHLRDMLDGLADVAVTEGSPIGRVRERTVPLAELADAVLDAAAVPPARRAPRIEPDGAAVRCDPQRLRRVLTNLVENAVKYAPVGPIELRCASTVTSTRFTVTDGGPGIPVQDQERVFERFVQLDQSSTRRQGGTGLGLHLCRNVTALLGGSLSVRDRGDGLQGAVFELTIPHLAPTHDELARPTHDRHHDGDRAAAPVVC